MFYDALNFLKSFLASSSLVVPGAQVSPEYGEAVGISFEQTEYTTEGEQRGNPSWLFGSQGICITIYIVE